jgi:energy-converting hydrogenase B subunit D
MSATIAVLVLVCIAAPGVVLANTTLRRLMAFSLFGITLTLLFFVYRAPDVALSEIAVGTLAVPFMVLVTMVKLKDVGQ